MLYVAEYIILNMHRACFNLMAILVKNSMREMSIIVSETLESEVSPRNNFTPPTSQIGKLHVAPLPLGVSLLDALSGFTALGLLIIIAQSLIVKKIKTLKQKIYVYFICPNA